MVLFINRDDSGLGRNMGTNIAKSRSIAVSLVRRWEIFNELRIVCGLWLFVYSFIGVPVRPV